jgi:cytosine/adenosine deaminase-related metal-dependent hydrolase
MHAMAVSLRSGVETLGLRRMQPSEDAGRRLVLPGLVEAHTHLDKIASGACPGTSQ